MSEEILINVTPMETRVAVIENGVLQDVHIERTQKRGFAGNIYKGKVVRVLPGMQAAFVDIGLERASFIHASDMLMGVPGERDKLDPDTSDVSKLEHIQTFAHEGKKLIVQVIKDPLGTKGARLTSHLSMPSRYMVFVPDNNHIGVSQRIEDETERERLKNLVTEIMNEDDIAIKGGFIIRTAAEGQGYDEIKHDILYLKCLWQAVQRRITNYGTPSVIYEDLPLSLRTIRDMVHADVEKIRIDSRETFQKITEFVTDFMPESADKLEWYPGERPLFDLYSVEEEIQKALSRKVQLKSGGYLIIDQTEAMTTIDVNTGGFVGHRNLEETIFKTNLEAATALSRQLRVRNLGGIIIVDFIDMKEEEHKRQVLRTLEKALERDHAKTAISGVTELGLVQITRKRSRDSLSGVLSEVCPSCEGRGTIKSAETVCYEIFREILREERAYDNDTYMVLASQSVVDRLLDEESANVADLEEFIGKTIRFQVESMYSQEQFDVVLL